MATTSNTGRIRVGIGGWTYAPWRGGGFYPEGWPQARELEYASAHLTAIEINATYYGTQKPESFARWREATPADFVFSLKASRHATNRRVLAEAGPSIERFLHSGLAELGAKLGPIVWQFAPTKRFEPQDFEAFLALLPERLGGLPLRHAMEVRHASFMTSAYVALARRFGVATVFTDSALHPSFADASGGFVYARLMRAEAGRAAGYAPAALDAIAAVSRQWAAGEQPDTLPRAAPAQPQPPTLPQDVFVFFINGAKERAPAAALALIERLA